MVSQSFKGRKRQLHYIRVQVGADTLKAIEPAIEGRPASAQLLKHWRHRQIGPDGVGEGVDDPPVSIRA